MPPLKTNMPSTLFSVQIFCMNNVSWLACIFTNKYYNLVCRDSAWIYMTLGSYVVRDCEGASAPSLLFHLYRTTASVVRKIDATELALVNAVIVTFAGSITPISAISPYSSSCALYPYAK